jgi:CubicO group peptidase (beta-lactamase class C family)
VARGYLRQPNDALVDTTVWSGGVGVEGGLVADARDEARFLEAFMQGRLLGPRRSPR